jgi:hypothetical protein
MNPGIIGGRFLKALAGSFVILLIIIIAIANRGEGDRWWSFIHDIPYGDKLGHIALMGTLCLLCNLAFATRRFRFLPACITRVTFVLLGLVTLEEFSQAFIPTRSCDPLDWLADLAGLALGQATAMTMKH